MLKGLYIVIFVFLLLTMRGLLFDIKRFTTEDGPGIRVTYFFKGCPMSCIWCHNPEGIAQEPMTVKRVERVGSARFTKSEVVGREYDIEELVDVAARERPFIEQSGGGVTFSGGEPLMQPEFLERALIRMREEGYHTAVDTSGFAEREHFKLILPHTSLFLYDIKHIDDARHREFTGVTSKRVLGNFDSLVKEGADIVVRIPVIPGFNDDEESMKAIRDYIDDRMSDRIKGIDLLPYHRTGSGKYGLSGRDYLMGGKKPIADGQIDAYRALFSAILLK